MWSRGSQAAPTIRKDTDTSNMLISDINLYCATNKDSVRSFSYSATACFSIWTIIPLMGHNPFIFASTMRRIHLAIAILSLIASQVSANTLPAKRNDYDQTSQCRCIPGDSCWPSIEKWQDLNNTVNGRLIATIPAGHPCHDPTYDEAVCSTLQGEWDDPKVQ